MDILKTAVFAACAAGIISSLLTSAAPGGSEKAILRLMIGSAVIIVLIKPLSGIGAGDILNLTEGLGSLGAEQQSDFSDFDIRAAQISVRLELEKLMREQGIDFSQTVISCSKDEYDVISIDSAEITVQSSADRDRLTDLAQQQEWRVPLTVKVADTDETGLYQGSDR